MTTSRRELLKFAGAGAALSAIGGCASTPEVKKPLGQVVIVGGGWGGTTAAKYIRMWSGGTIQVFLIERNPAFVSCPLSNLVLSGSRKIEDLTIPYTGLRDYGVQVLRDEVTGINRERKRVQLKRIEDLRYDRLIVSPGVDFMYDQIAGLNSPEAQKIILHAWKAGPETVALRAQLESMRDGGVVILSIPRAPYRCPPGPYERACQIALYLRNSKPKSKLLVLDANENIISKAGLFGAAWKSLYANVLEYRPNNEVKEVDAKGLSVKTDFDTIKADVINVVPPMRAGDIARTAGLITANNRWCGVDWRTMESTAVKDIHVLGDSTLSAPAMPKSGHMANSHGKIAAGAIVALMSGREVNPTPVIANTCYSFMSDQLAAHVASVHRYDPEKKDLLPVAGAGGVSAQNNALEHQYAQAWARNIWNDMLT